MEPWLIAFVAFVAFLAAAVTAGRSRRTLAELRRLTGRAEDSDVVAAVRDLGDRAVRAEAARVAAVREHEQFEASLDEGLLVVGDGMRISRANPAADAALGRAPGTLVGRSLIETFLDTQVEAIAAEASATGSASGEVAVGGPDGHRLLIRARRAPSGDLWLLLEDVSELRRLQQIRTEFIDNLSHELRTPITTVSLLAETLTRDAQAAGDAVPARMRDRIAKIEIETGHLVQMVSELLDLSRIESGGALGAMEPLDLGRIATESTERLRLFAERQGVALRVEVASPLPRVLGDADRLGQVFINLLHNAIKFSPEGGDVSVSVGPAGGDVVVAIADHGVGIPRAAQGRIFERFYKVDRARIRGATGGTGLGLAIARHIVEQHGGRIRVESTEGVGSTFSFSIPIAPEPD